MHCVYIASGWLLIGNITFQPVRNFAELSVILAKHFKVNLSNHSIVTKSCFSAGRCSKLLQCGCALDLIILSKASFENVRRYFLPFGNGNTFLYSTRNEGITLRVWDSCTHGWYRLKSALYIVFSLFWYGNVGKILSKCIYWKSCYLSQPVAMSQKGHQGNHKSLL